MKKYIYLLIFLLTQFVLTTKHLQAQWVPTNLSSNVVNALVVDGTNLYAGTNVGIFRSVDNGINWSRINGLTNREILALIVSGNNIFAGTGNGFFRSTDLGASWHLINLGVQNYIYTLAAYDTNLFAGGSSLYKSTDDGASWKEILPYGWVFDIAFNANSMGTKDLFVGVGYEQEGAGKIYRSGDNGISWSLISKDIYTHMIYTMAFGVDSKGETNFFAGTWYKGIYLSTNNGESWTHVNKGFSWYPNGDLEINVILAYDTTAFAGTCYYGVYLWNNNERGWNDINEGLTNLEIRSLIVSGSYIFVGTNGSGVFRRSLQEIITTVESASNNSPNHYELVQNYPNPFNPGTKISWQSPVASYQTLKVYDVLGNEVATLVNEYKPAGKHEVTFDASKLSSGIYFYKLQTGNFISTKKMILLK